MKFLMVSNSIHKMWSQNVEERQQNRQEDILHIFAFHFDKYIVRCYYQTKKLKQKVILYYAINPTVQCIAYKSDVFNTPV